MKHSHKKELRLQPGTGYLIGSVLTIISAVAVFLLSENVVVALSSSIPVGFTVGILIEQSLQQNEVRSASFIKKAVNALLIIGLMLLIIIFILQKFI